MTRADSEVIQSNGFDAFVNSQDRLIVQLLIFHDSTRLNLLAAQLELRLDKDEKGGAAFCHRYCGLDYFLDRDEGNINHHDVDAFGKIFNAQFARVPLNWDDVGVLAQLPVKLFDIHVDGVDAHCAAL